MRDKRLREILAFATALETQLGNRDLLTHVDDETLDKVRLHVEKAHKYCQKPKHDADNNEELETVGTALWNTTTRMIRGAPDLANGVLAKKTAVYGRVLAFHLLDAAEYNEKTAQAQDVVVRLMRLALKASKTAIDESEYGLASYVFQKAADYNVKLTDKSYTPATLEEAKDIRGLEAEYYILRTIHSWKENNWNVAEHMYNKGHPTDNTLEPRYAEQLADVLYEIGKDMMAKNKHDMAERWLGRAYDTINSRDVEHLSRDGLILRTAILQAHVSSLLQMNTNETRQQADNLLEYMLSETGTTMAALSLRLELLGQAPHETFDSTSYASVLAQMIDSLKQTDIDMEPVENRDKDLSFKLIVHHIQQKLHKTNPALACDVLDKFITVLSKTNSDGWLDRLVIMRLWMAAIQPDSLSSSVKAVYTAIDRINNPLSAEATLHAQTVIWKMVAIVYDKGLFDVAEACCQLALHRIFEKTNATNRAKIERKLMLCALAREDFDAAKSIHLNLTAETRQEPKTWYLLYKAAVRIDDWALAARCLEDISQVSNPIEYLYACCMDAKTAGRGEYARDGIVKLLEETRYISPSPIHLPALLRCLIGLYIKDYERLSEDAEGRAVVAVKLCDTFELAVEHMSKDSRDVQGNKLFDIKELDWFGRNSYNLGTSDGSEWDGWHIIRILRSCLAIMSHYPHDICSEIAADLKLRELFCNFVIAYALLAEARAEDNIEKQLQHYLLMRKHIATFDAEVPAQLSALTGEAREDMFRKQALLQGFDFEAAVRLKDWDSLGQNAMKVAECNSPKTLMGMADCILDHRHNAPSRVIYSTLRKLVNQLSEVEGMDITKLARYMRGLFQVTLPCDDELALGLAKEFADLIAEAKKFSAPMPIEEIEWLATISFNKAVDFYDAAENELCEKWAFQAFGIAHQMRDGGSLEKRLHEQFAKLDFGQA